MRETWSFCDSDLNKSFTSWAGMSQKYTESLCFFHYGQFFLIKRWPYLPGHHGLQTKIGNEALIVTFCIWLLWSPSVDLKTFIVAHMDEVLWLDDEGKFELEHKVTE